MNKGNGAKIYFRVFPTEDMTWTHVKILNDEKTVYVRNLQDLARTRPTTAPIFRSFKTEGVFYNNSQQEIYNEVLAGVLENVMEGLDGIIMAYGQTGSGKSLTISGLHGAYEDRGILVRVIEDVFKLLALKTAKKSSIKTCVKVSYVEFSKVNVSDLLAQYPNWINSLKGITKVKVRNANEALELLFQGEAHKEFSEHVPYLSNLRTSIFTLYIASKDADVQESQLCRSKLHIVDLAGADTIGNSSCSFKNHTDVGAANLAKTQLEQFFLVLYAEAPERIKLKYRLNPMIQYLGDCLHSRSILRLVGHIKVGREDLLITLSMLRFGDLIGGLKSSTKSKSYQESTENILGMPVKQDLGKFLSDERIGHVRRTLDEFLQNKISKLTLMNVCDVGVVLDLLKTTCKQSEKEKPKSSLTVIQPEKSKSNSHHKVFSKRSRESTKSASSIGSKTLSNRISSTDKRSALSVRSDLKLSKEKVPSLNEMKASGSGLLKRSSSSRRKSASNSSVSNSKFKSNEVLMPNIIPEYCDAWKEFRTEKNDEYNHWAELYTKNNDEAENVYRTYLAEVENLKEIVSRVERWKNDLMMVQMTQEFNKINNSPPTSDQFERCCQQEINKAEQERVDKRELVLKCQAELKAHIHACQAIKEDLQNCFDTFCKDKYQTPVVDLTVVKSMPSELIQSLKDIEEEKAASLALEPQKNKTQEFERLKMIFAREMEKKRLIKLKRREWTMY